MQGTSKKLTFRAARSSAINLSIKTQSQICSHATIDLSEYNLHKLRPPLDVLSMRANAERARCLGRLVRVKQGWKEKGMAVSLPW